MTGTASGSTRLAINAAAATFIVPLLMFAGLQSRPRAVESAKGPTFSKEVLPILQRSCQNCHRPDSVAPMSLLTYDEVRPWAKAIKFRTGLRNRMGVMPPWFIEKNVGIQSYKEDISLSDQEIATLAEWVDNGAPRGNPADAPPPVKFADQNSWIFGEPDLVVDSPPLTMKANSPDWWGMLPPVPTGLKEDRYVAAMQVKEISSVKGPLGGKYIVHHAAQSLMRLNGAMGDGVGGGHEVGRNAEIFEEKISPMITAGSQLFWNSVHAHASSVDATAFLRTGYKFRPKDYKPEYKENIIIFGSSEIDLEPMKPAQEVHFQKVLKENTLLTTFEPHMHAAGVRLCLEAIWADRAETLSCSGYDHNWVRTYKYADDAAPLLPKGTILHVICYFDNTPSNRNVIDPRNWSGFGHRSIDNMAVMLVPGAALTDEQFHAEMAARRAHLRLTKGQTVIGCPLCGVEDFGRPRMQTTTAQNQ